MNGKRTYETPRQRVQWLQAERSFCQSGELGGTAPDWEVEDLNW